MAVLLAFAGWTLATLFVAIVAAGAAHPALDARPLVLLAARIGQTVTHVAFTQTRVAVSVRFTFYVTQLACMVTMGAFVAGGYTTAG